MRARLPALLVLLAATAGRADAQFGPVLTGAGPVSRSFGGAETAAPLSPTGALVWNPAAITGFDRSEVDFGFEYLMPHTSLASVYGANALGAGVPPERFGGSRVSDTPGAALPNVGLVYLPDDSRFAYGLGVFAAAGLGADYAADPTNPLLTPPPPRGVGLGPIYSEYAVLQIAPSVAYRLTDRVSVAVGPTIDLATLRVDPGIFLPPNDANGDGFATYPTALRGRATWGGGFAAGVYYRGDVWSAGASYKSPQWFDTFRFNTTDEVGRPRTGSFGLDLPRIASVGAAYTGVERLLVAVDLRYLGYRSARGFGDRGFRADGALAGVGWRDAFAVAAGAQYRLTESVSARCGYTFGTNPVPSAQSGVNVASPTIVEHIASVGLSWSPTEDLTLSAAYLHAFRNSIHGPLQTPAGAVPGTDVRSTASGDSIVIGASVRFGRRGRRCSVPAGDPVETAQ